jgi:hypothetical protein
MHYSIGPESATDLNNFGKHDDWVNKRRDGDLCTHENLQKRLTECGDTSLFRKLGTKCLATLKRGSFHKCTPVITLNNMEKYFGRVCHICIETIAIT